MLPVVVYESPEPVVSNAYRVGSIALGQRRMMAVLQASRAAATSASGLAAAEVGGVAASDGDPSLAHAESDSAIARMQGTATARLCTSMRMVFLPGGDVFSVGAAGDLVLHPLPLARCECAYSGQEDVGGVDPQFLGCLVVGAALAPQECVDEVG